MRNLLKNFFTLNFLYIALIAAQFAAIIFLCLFIPSYLPVALAFALVWLTSAIASLVLFARDGAAEVKCAWFVLIAALPVAGSLIYLFSAAKKKPCGILKVKAKNPHGLSAAANALCGTAEVGYDSAEYFKDGADFFQAVIAQIESAKRTVYIEFFIVSRGHILNAFMRAIEKALANGAEVKIIYDGIGSAFRISKRNFKQLEKAGAQIKIFHKLTPLPRARLNLRDHRKIVAVDGAVAFTGGINIADEYANLQSPYGHWKDSGVAVYGAAAKVFEGMFLSVWQNEYEMDLPEGGKHRCLPFYDSPPHIGFCEDLFVFAINSAKMRVHILTPYFCISQKTAAALTFASRRGLDVKVIIPHIPDKKYVMEISKAYACELKKSGVQFYEYIPGFMHAKCVICDDSVFLGSYNFDYRSTHFNFECGLMFKGDMCDEAERDFEECLTLSAPVTEDKIPSPKKLYRLILKLFAPLM